MTWSFNTGSRYHTQDTGYYCGAACAMMILNEIGVPYSDLDQDDLYLSNNSHNAKSGWYTDPYGLRYTLVDRRPASFTNTFVVYKPTTEAEGTRKIVYTLWHYQVSPAVLVYHCQHWIVVRGIQTSVEPSATGAYNVEGLWVNNPVFEDNEPHSGTDVCGSGGTHGVENQWVSYATWQDTYFTGCNYDSTDGSNQFISVCDPDEPRITLPQSERFEPISRGRVLLDPQRSVKLLHEGLEARVQLPKTEASERLRRGRFAEPMLVMRLDRRDSYYYLSQSMMGDQVVGYGQIDARFGTLQSIYTLEEKSVRYNFDRESVHKRLSGMTLHLPEERGRLRLRPGTYCLSRTMVWRPCRESYSPHLPFWQINVGADTLYMRVDGRVFSHLTMIGKGM